MPRKRLLRQLFLSYVVVIIVCLVASSWFATKALEDAYTASASGHLLSAARFVAEQAADGFTAEPQQLIQLASQVGRAMGVRLTLVKADGRVLADTREDPDKMENHASRPEIAAALHGNDERIARFSTTLGERMLYVAIPVRAGNQIVGVVRAAIGASEIDQEFTRTRNSIIGAAFVVGLAAAMIGWWLARGHARTVGELMQGDCESLAAICAKSSPSPMLTNWPCSLNRSINWPSSLRSEATRSAARGMSRKPS